MKKISLFFFLLLSIVTYSKSLNEKELKSFFEYLTILEFKQANSSINKMTNPSLQKDLSTLLYIISDNGQSLKSKLTYNLVNYTITEKKNTVQNAIQNLTKAYFLLWYEKKRVESYRYFYNAYNSAQKSDSKNLKKYTLISLLTFYKKGNLQNDGNFQKYLDEYEDLCENTNDYLIYLSNKFNLSMQTEVYNEKESSYEKKNNALLTEYDSVANLIDNKLLTFYYKDKGNIIIRQHHRQAEKLFKKLLDIIDTTTYFKPIKYLTLCNLSRVYSLTEEHRKGLNYLKEAKKYRNINDTLKNNIALSIYKAQHYNKLKMYDSAYYLSEKVRKLGYLYNFQKHNTEISKIREELESEKKEKENIKLKADKEQYSFLLFGALFLLISGGIIAYLNLKNSKKKRLLAEQQKELEKQKNLTLLKEQEINTINAMVEGQEKERIRIAEDLHDNIGSVLATLKLHFENLKLNRGKKHFNQDELYEKTEKLIDETYLKVRSIAHAKNAGVIANQGLLVAVKIMAEKISAANKLKIDIIDFGLEKKLDTNTEISVFRIIQELTTNIIKHADATEATISISQFNDTLNIIVEDNGKGFNSKEIIANTGMGLHSIQKRIEHLDGTFQIDSSPKSGTSIIINLTI
ncbi:sensor histidine kinase [uncultured Tenacibaculum sp.]|uniref:sensor histidine kinase n=1 Tax=uncultured Tenacibaculum sp. TaxID=174713 RepID=UPI002622FC75|nr:sensor histidine kinase [uncultured Tenacibaculum sp.]